MLSKKINKYILILTLWLVCSISYAAEFQATVSDLKIVMGQSLQINFALKDAKAKQAPDFSRLSRDFKIYSQQKYSTFSSTNGVMSSEAGWDITLLPLREGELVIPSIQVLTDNGVLSSTEIRIVVMPTKSSSTNYSALNQHASPEEGLGISMIATTNKAKVYTKEPIIYTLKIISYRSIMNVALEDIRSNDASIDKIGQPKQYDQIIGGKPAHIIEIKYYVTPINAGKVTITPAEIHGEIQSNTPSRSGYSSLNNFFFNDAIFKPFKLRGDPVNITAMAPPINDKTWLPLQDLTITEEWNGATNAKVGDTIIRKIKLIAKGGFSNQIPNMQSFMEGTGLKVYADKPTLSDDVSSNGDTIVGIKEETYTLVAGQEGTVTLPQVSIPWWNLQTKALSHATLPAKTLTILPATITNNHGTLVDYSAPTEDAATTQVTLIQSIKQHSGLLMLLTGLGLLIFGLCIVILYLLRNQKQMIKKSVARKKIFSKTNALDKPIINVVALRNHIILYAIKHWHAPKNITLNKLGTFLTDNNYQYNLEVYVKLCHEINSELYASATAELAILIDAWQQLRDSVTKVKLQKTEHNSSDYINLNPT